MDFIYYFTYNYIYIVYNTSTLTLTLMNNDNDNFVSCWVRVAYALSSNYVSNVRLNTSLDANLERSSLKLILVYSILTKLINLILTLFRSR